jgi:predicted N-acyltransferase
MNIRIFRSIRDIDSSVWNSIVGLNRLICTHNYLCAIESSKINDCRYYYPVVYDGDRVIAHTCVYFITTELDAFAQGLVKQAVEWMRRRWRYFMIMRSLECGTPVALGNTISFRAGIDRKAVLMLILREVERLAKETHVGVMLLRDFYPEELEFYDCLLDAGYTRLQNLPCARLQVRWRSFEDYLNSMRNQYRYKIRSRMRKFQAKGATIEVINDFAPLAAELARLWRNAYDHATEYRRERLLEDFFVNMSSHLGEKASVLMARIDGRPVGFSLLLHDDKTLTQLFCGLDYLWNRECFVYFNMLYEIVAMAISNGFQDIDFGITTIVPKLDVGAKVVPLHMYMRHLSSLLREVVPKMFSMMTPSCPVISRSVFRQ